MMHGSTKLKKKHFLTHLSQIMTNLSRVIRLLTLLNAELNPICHLLALFGAHHILHVSGLKVKLINKGGERRNGGFTEICVYRLDYLVIVVPLPGSE